MHQSPLAPPLPIMPARLPSWPNHGAVQARSNRAEGFGPIMPAKSTAGAGGPSRVIQGAFPAGRPRIPVSAPRPGQMRTLPLKPAMASGNATLLPDDFALARSFAPGRAMAPAIQARMESLFGTRFGDVRIHEGPEASAIGATAFTQGSSITFAPGQYNPNSPRGQRLLAQQLAYVVQQRSGRVRNPFNSGLAVVNDPVLKVQAEMMGSRAEMSQALQPKGLNNHQHGTRAGHQALAPILPGQARQNASTPGAAMHAQGAIPRSVFAPILPSRAAFGFGAAVQPLMNVVARGRDLWNSVITPVARGVMFRS
jgi:hypothetical protein